MAAPGGGGRHPAGQAPGTDGQQELLPRWRRRRDGDGRRRPKRHRGTLCLARASPAGSMSRPAERRARTDRGTFGQPGAPIMASAASGGRGPPGGPRVSTNCRVHEIRSPVMWRRTRRRSSATSSSWRALRIGAAGGAGRAASTWQQRGRAGVAARCAARGGAESVPLSGKLLLLVAADGADRSRHLESFVVKAFVRRGFAANRALASRPFYSALSTSHRRSLLPRRQVEHVPMALVGWLLAAPRPDEGSQIHPARWSASTTTPVSVFVRAQRSRDREGSASARCSRAPAVTAGARKRCDLIVADPDARSVA